MNVRRLRYLPLVTAFAVAATMWADETALPIGSGLGDATLGGSVETSASFPAGAAVPEPGTVALAAVGAAVLLISGARARRR